MIGWLAWTMLAGCSVELSGSLVDGVTGNALSDVRLLARAATLTALTAQQSAERWAKLGQNPIFKMAQK